MPRYLVERQFEVTEEQMPEVGKRSRRVRNEHFPEINWEHSHVAVDDTGNVRTFCLYEAPSEDVIRAHANGFGSHTIVSIREIVGDVTPEDFPLD